MQQHQYRSGSAGVLGPDFVGACRHHGLHGLDAIAAARTIHRNFGEGRTARGQNYQQGRGLRPRGDRPARTAPFPSSRRVDGNPQSCARRAVPRAGPHARGYCADARGRPDSADRPYHRRGACGREEARAAARPAVRRARRAVQPAEPAAPSGPGTDRGQSRHADCMDAPRSGRLAGQGSCRRGLRSGPGWPGRPACLDGSARPVLAGRTCDQPVGLPAAITAASSSGRGGRRARAAAPSRGRMSRGLGRPVAGARAGE
jgi:hypothetical protein